MAYEVAQMASTLPASLRPSEADRKLMGMPASTDPATTGQDPSTARQREAARFTAVESVRAKGRQVYEGTVGGRTYSITFRNERFAPDGTDAVHVIEADAPWTPAQQAAFEQFVQNSGLIYEVRKTRVSLFKPLGSSPSSS